MTPPPAASTSALAHALLTALAPAPPPASVFVSPASVACALALLQAGAAAGSPSAAQLAGVGGSVDAAAALSATALADAAPTGGPTVACANGVWAPKDVRLADAYVAAVGKLGAVARPLTSAADVNGWVADVTRQKITSIVPNDVAARAVVILANAVYFKGNWESAFDARLSRPLPFRTGPATTITAHGMRRLVKGAPYAANAALAGAIRLPYAGGTHEAVVALAHDDATPPAAVVRAVEAADAAPDNDGTGWTRPLAGVQLTLPKFSAEWGGDVKSALVAAGVTAPFTSGADFDRMLSTGTPPPVSDVLHKVVVDVDETGTEAAAATAVAMTRAMLAAPEDLYVDRPFLFGVRHVETREWLFVGHVVSGVAEWKGEAAPAAAVAAGVAPPGATAAARGTEF